MIRPKHKLWYVIFRVAFVCMRVCAAECQTEFQCRNSDCVPYPFICDEDDDCGDQSDEIMCAGCTFCYFCNRPRGLHFGDELT